LRKGDYTHVTDLASAHVLFLEKLLAHQKIASAYNLGTGVGASVFDIVRAVEEVTGHPVRYAIGDRRQGGPSQLIANSKAAQQDLQWQPKIPAIQDIVSTTWLWMGK